MRYQGKAQGVADQLIDAFKTGRVPGALSKILIHRDHPERPCDSWSVSNRFLIALLGHTDARGFRQWQKVGRSVRKGETACYILVPITVRAKKKKDEPDAEESDAEAKRPTIVGFKAAPVFGYAQTEGDPLPGEEEEAAFFDALPLVDVARAWGIKLHTLDIDRSAPGELGTFAYWLDATGSERLTPESITLSAENLSVWAHELVHAADAKLGTITPKVEQQLDNEIVAQLGASTLLECIGRPIDSDPGGTWRYIRRYAEEHERNPISLCTELLERTVACVEAILAAADALGAGPADFCAAEVA